MLLGGQINLLFVGLPLLVVLFGLAVLFAERKLIALAQKRLGISFLGRNGWAHLPADVLKFWLKQVQSPGTF
jgi:NADH:ubiquinone oxidoreductase subunit H